MGIILAYLFHRVKQRHLSEFHGWSRTWLDFRDAFGVVWALRVMERVNTMPAAMEAGVRLNWDGFYELLPAPRHATCTTAGEKEATANPSSSHSEFSQSEFSHSEEVETRPASIFAMEPLDAGLRNLMRRFVSKRWLEVRLNVTQNDAE
jgi:hypothetical protein